MGGADRRDDWNRRGKRGLHGRVKCWNDDAFGIDRGRGADDKDHAASQRLTTSANHLADQLQCHGDTEGCDVHRVGHKQQFDLRRDCLVVRVVRQLGLAVDFADRSNKWRGQRLGDIQRRVQHRRCSERRADNRRPDRVGESGRDGRMRVYSHAADDIGCRIRWGGSSNYDRHADRLRLDRFKQCDVVVHHVGHKRIR